MDGGCLVAASTKMFSRIDIRNFKSIREATLDLRELTVLVGANSAGKSSLIQALHLLAQIVRGRIQPDLVSLNSLELNLGNFSDVLHSSSPGGDIQLGLTTPLSTWPFRRVRTTARDQSQGKQASPDQPVTSNERESSWSIKLSEPADQLGVATVEQIDVADIRAGVTLSIRPSQQMEEIERLFNQSRRLGLIRGSPSRRAQLVSDAFRATRFSGQIDVLGDRETVGEPEETIPAVAVENGLPNELYIYETESHGLAQKWLELKRRRTELAIHPKRRGRSARDVMKERRAGEGAEVQPAELASILFPEFRKWVDELDRRAADAPPPSVEELTEEQWEAVVGVEESVSWALSELLETSRPDRGAITTHYSPTIEIAAGFRSLLYNSVHYLGPLREGPSLSYRPGQTGDVATLGLKGEYAVSYLHMYRSQDTICPKGDGTTSVMELGQAVDYWAQQFGIAKAFKTHDTGRAGIELELVDPQTGEKRDLLSVGVGVSQLLPVILLSLLAQPGELVLLEQPELHVHPGPQQVLGDFLLAVAESGRQLIVETHSEYLINRLRLRIAEDQVGSTSELIQIWYAQREDGRTRFDSMRLNRFGTFDEWPEGFFDQGPKDAEEILRAAAGKRRSREGAG